MTKEKDKLKQELDQFQNIWHGGYFTGYSQKRNQKGLEEYLRNNVEGSTLLEIGCGGGQWTKFIYELNIFKKIICVDALSEKHNEFWGYVGNEARKTISYFQIRDFQLSDIENESIDFVFSYDVFCHISKSGINQYLQSLNLKCTKDAELLIMYADPEKYLKSEPENRQHVIKYLPKNKFIYKLSNKKLIKDALADSDGMPNTKEPRWFWIGKELFENMSLKHGYKIVDLDLNIDKTNPIALLKKV